MRFYTLVLGLFLLALPIIPAQAASAPPIFPAASVFILPSASVGGTPTVSTSKNSSPFDISSPGAAYCRGQTTIESDYAVAQSPINYTIRQLPSTSAASCVDMAQQHVLLSSYAPLVASQGLPGEWIRGAVHNVHSEIWTGIVFRNLELLASIDSDYAANRKNQAVRQALNTLLTVEQRLLGRAQAFATHPSHTPTATPPIFPPDSVFALPPNAVRQPVKNVSEAFQSPAKSLDQAFGLFTHQHGSYSYFVTTFRSSTDAVQYDGTTKSGNHGYTLLRIRQPVTPGEWLKEDANVPPDSGTNGGPYGAISVGLVYRNLSMIVYVYVEYHDAPATKTSRMDQATQIALDTASQLYGRAQAFAAHPFKAPPPAPAPPSAPSLTPAQQDRNAAMRSLVTQINDVLDPCRAGFSIVSNDVQDLINKSGSVATTDGDAYNALSPCDAARTALEGLTPSNVLKGYASIHTLIQQEAKVTRTYVNYLILVKADMDDAMNGRAPIGTASDFTKASDVAKAQDQQGIDLMHQIDQAWHYSS
jgi:hypothetical protein